jgi:hypothetical protein
LARGELFMWAAHDDKWSPHYARVLADRLVQSPEAVLATPAVIHIREDGRWSNEPPDRPAEGKSKLLNLKLLFEDHASTWIYGLWRTSWLSRHMQEYEKYPLWGADVLWLADICLRFSVVGSQDAVIYKRLLPSRYAPKTARAAVAFWVYMFWHLTQISLNRTHGFRQRTRTLLLSWTYAYRLCIRRPHLLRTAWRVVRVVSLAAITSIPVAILYIWRRFTGRLQPSELV